MHSPFLFFSVAAALIPFTQAVNYYVDPTCDMKYSDISKTSFPEAWDMASKVLAKMTAGNDAGEQIAYANLFKAGSIQRPTIMGYFATFSSMTAVTTPEQAEIIYVCDNDDRWIKAKDEKGEDRDGDHWVDPVYHMRAEKALSCKKGSVIMTTYRKFLPDTQGWHQPRTVISVCDKLSRSYKGWATVSKFEDRLLAGEMVPPDGGNSVKIPSILDNPCTSRTILHEVFHSHLITPTPKRDVPVQTGKAYGWAQASSLSAIDQLANADNYAVYAFANYLKGYRVGDTDAQKQKGILIQVNASTKRALKTIRSIPKRCRDWLHRRENKRCEIQIEG